MNTFILLNNKNVYEFDKTLYDKMHKKNTNINFKNLITLIMYKNLCDTI